jgi:hypothetical protein
MRLASIGITALIVAIGFAGKAQAQNAAGETVAFMDRYFAKHWQEAKVTPSERCSDHLFLRRASLDLIGRIPTVPEIDAFLHDSPEERRTRLIDRLLRSDQAPRHWANLWTYWLLGMGGDPEPRDAFHGWLQQHFAKNGSHKELALKLLLAKGSTRDNPAGLFIALNRGFPVPEKDWKYAGKFDMFPLSGQVFRVLHGRRLGCLQCHDHPHDDLRQLQFHEINLFFRQVDVIPDRSARSVFEIRDDPALSATPHLTIERRGRPRGFVPRFFDDGFWKPGMKQTRREFFTARFIAHPDFARGFVNRMWALLLGHGLCTNPASDDFSTNNPVVHEEVLGRLSREFVRSNYDPRTVLRVICLSDCYGRDSVANKTNDGPDKVTTFSRQQARAMSNEQLVESLLTALQYPADERPQARRGWLRELYSPRWDEQGECHHPCSPYGRFTQDTDLAGFRMLWLLNGNSVDTALNHKSGTLAALFKEHPKLSAEAIQKLFLHALSRPATPREIKRLTDPATLGRTPKLDSEAIWRAYSTDLLWALLNSGEFALNR